MRPLPHSWCATGSPRTWRRRTSSKCARAIDPLRARAYAPRSVRSCRAAAAVRRLRRARRLVRAASALRAPGAPCRARARAASATQSSSIQTRTTSKRKTQTTKRHSCVPSSSTRAQDSSSMLSTCASRWTRLGERPASEEPFCIGDLGAIRKRSWRWRRLRVIGIERSGRQFAEHWLQR